MARPSKLRSAVVLGLVLSAGLVACVSAGGCYKRVVAARGLGAGAYDVSEPYQENSKVDDWVFGERATHDKIVRPKPAAD